MDDRPIEEILEDLAAEVPQEEWDQLPADLTDRLDYYLYDEEFYHHVQDS